MRAKVPEIVRLIEHRLKVGDYATQSLPSERSLAAELGVSYMTARKAVQEIKRKGAIRGRAGRRITRTKTLQIALLAPAFDSTVYNTWRAALTRVVGAHQGIVRPIGYVGWSDPVITDTLDSSFDGIFMIAPSMLHLPTVLVERLRSQRHRLVTLFDDFTELGIPCVDMASPLFIHKLAAHVAELGHRRVACLNTQPVSSIIQKRMDAWQAAAEQLGLESHLINEPVAPFEHADHRAYEVASRAMEEGPLSFSACFCTLTLAAMGVYRAAYERGIKVGRDLSVCSCDGYEQARLLTPSLTTLRHVELDDILKQGMAWLLSGGKGWDKPLWIHPRDIPLWIGESTGPCRTRDHGGTNRIEGTERKNVSGSEE